MTIVEGQLSQPLPIPGKELVGGNRWHLLDQWNTCPKHGWISLWRKKTCFKLWTKYWRTTNFVLFLGTKNSNRATHCYRRTKKLSKQEQLQIFNSGGNKTLMCKIKVFSREQVGILTHDSRLGEVCGTKIWIIRNMPSFINNYTIPIKSALLFRYNEIFICCNVMCTFLPPLLVATVSLAVVYKNNLLRFLFRKYFTNIKMVSVIVVKNLYKYSTLLAFNTVYTVSK